MNTYLIPIVESSSPYIKKIIAPSEKIAKEKLFNYFFDKYEFLEGDSLEEIEDQLLSAGMDFGQIHDAEEFI